MRTLSMAIELPVLLIASIGVGGWLGYLLDRWLHKDSIFTLLLGALGFAAGIAEILRRLGREEKKEEKGGPGSNGG